MTKVILTGERLKRVLILVKRDNKRQSMGFQEGNTLGYGNKGIKQTEEHIKKIHTDEANRKIGEANIDPNQPTRHHVFYSRTNPDAGVVIITKKLHDRVHQLQAIFERLSNPWFTLEGVNKPCK